MSFTVSHAQFQSKILLSVHLITFVTKFVDCYSFDNTFNSGRMYQCVRADCSYATPSLFILHRNCQMCHHVRGDSEARSMRRRCGVSVWESNIAVLGMTDIEVVVDETNTPYMDNNEGVMVTVEMNDNDLEEMAVMTRGSWLRLQIFFHLSRWWWPTRRFHPYWR